LSVAGGWRVGGPRGGGARMAEALGLKGCARVYTSDIVDRGTGEDELLAFLSAQMPKLARFDMSATTPPFGQGGRQATAFIEVGLRRLPIGAMLALLLPCDFDSAKTRARFLRLPRVLLHDRAPRARRVGPAR